jgi:hypothetical protein
VYLLGGLLPNNNATVDPTTNIVQSYSTISKKWKNETALPLPLNHLNVATVGGKIYVLGGLTTELVHGRIGSLSKTHGHMTHSSGSGLHYQHRLQEQIVELRLLGSTKTQSTLLED